MHVYTPIFQILDRTCSVFLSRIKTQLVVVVTDYLIVLEWTKEAHRKNGTYWMLVRAEQYEILAECKNLTCDCRRFKQFSHFVKPYKRFWAFISSAFHVILMLILNSFGKGFFTCRIILFKYRYLVMQTKSKRVCHKHRKRNGYIKCIPLSWTLKSNSTFNQSNLTQSRPRLYAITVQMFISITARTCSSIHTKQWLVALSTVYQAWVWLDGARKMILESNTR